MRGLMTGVAWLIVLGMLCAFVVRTAWWLGGPAGWWQPWSPTDWKWGDG